MKFSIRLLMLTALLGLSAPANASTLNISSTAGTYDISGLGSASAGSVNDTFSGTLAAKTTVTFSFSVLASGDNNGNKGVSGGGRYDFYEKNGVVSLYWADGYSHYTGDTNAYENPGKSGVSEGGYNDAAHYNNWVAPYALMLSSVNLQSDGKSGTVTITNLSDAVVSYWANFVSTDAGYLGQAITYTVTSNAPLPAALPLFGVGLVLLKAARAKKRRG